MEGGIQSFLIVRLEMHFLRKAKKQARKAELEFEKWGEAYQISQTIQLLTHQTTLLPPSRHLAIHEIEKQAGGDECKGNVDVRVVVRGTEGIAEGREDGHEAAEA